jgi:S-DNA-T family DNA segregation ATPase FtsK/SpoIIIE
LKENTNLKYVSGVFLTLLSIVVFISMISFFFSWTKDQSSITALLDESIEVENIGKKFGLSVSFYLIYKGFGIGALFIPILTFIIGLSLTFNSGINKILDRIILFILCMFWFSLLASYFFKNQIYGGVFGFEMKLKIIEYVGDIGFIFLLLFGFLSFLIIKLKFKPVDLYRFFNQIIYNLKNRSTKKVNNDNLSDEIDIVENDEDMSVPTGKEPELNTVSSSAIKPTIKNFSNVNKEIDEKNIKDNSVEIVINKVTDEETITEKRKKILDEFGEFDETLELPSFKIPELKLLNDYGKNTSITVNQEELTANKEKIIETLQNYNIEIEKAKATIGPTVTLYEIIPAAGVRISKIKSLEDDIALSLSALGIRIIAPIPGKGTIGIEVPNKDRKIVSMKSLISSKKYQEAEMELPLALGKTISNDTLVTDLTKMPHLLVAGATGQGKSVGINAIITSILYKKHPAEVKFILVDPKKVELTLFNKIERHYLAKLPDSDEPIITDTKKVVRTLKSLCIEMDKRYELLKDATCRNIKEYNKKYKTRILNPNDGHKFLPYLVLIVDEFADIIMTAGKEVETPIGRLAQLARAVGIHLIIATQRPSVNVITGLIKANFPARIAFKVTSKVDSRTILDSGGADQLIGNGDMLYTKGNDLIRLQCGFVDLDEIEKITDIIGSQRGYSNAYLLPECEEDNISTINDNVEDRDPLFNDAAEIVVTAQQGSASLLQRKMKLGYNRAGRIIDQLEAAGIVGPFEGSKARAVLVKDLIDLKELLDN